MRERLLEETGLLGKRMTEQLDPELSSAGLLADFLLVLKAKRLGNVKEVLERGIPVLPNVQPLKLMALADQVVKTRNLEDDLEEFWSRLEQRE